MDFRKTSSTWFLKTWKGRASARYVATVVSLPQREISTLRLWICSSFCFQQPNLVVLLLPKFKCSLLSGAIFLLRCLYAASPAQLPSFKLRERMLVLGARNDIARSQIADGRDVSGLQCLWMCRARCPKPSCYRPPHGPGGRGGRPSRSGWFSYICESRLLTQAAEVQETCVGALSLKSLNTTERSSSAASPRRGVIAFNCLF